MKKIVPVVFLVLVAANVTRAQDDHAFVSSKSANVASDFENTSAATVPPKSFDMLLWPSAARTGSNVSIIAEPRSLAAPAEPSPAAPEPKFVYGSRDDFRWQLGLGISLVRFRSSLYYATGVGTNTSLTYFTNEWLGVEGNINTAFAPTINLNQHVKYVSYGAGPKIAWRARKWEPWAHALAGGMHVVPQTAGRSKNGFALQIGGGVDYRFYPHLSARVEVDWVKTHVFNEWGNSAQANADIVLHF
jgi:hypothetical protein